MNVKPSTPNNTQTIVFAAPVLIAIMAMMFVIYLGFVK